MRLFFEMDKIQCKSQKNTETGNRKGQKGKNKNIKDQISQQSG